MLVEQRCPSSAHIVVRGHRVRLRDQQPLSETWYDQVIDGEDPAHYLAELDPFVFLYAVVRDLSGTGLNNIRKK